MIVVSGEALMDVFDTGPTPQGQGLDARIGGSPLNVAIGLARLGQPVGFFGGIGRGFLGDRLLQALRDEGVDTTPVARPAAPTTLGLVGLDAQGVADYAFYGTGGADRLLVEADLARVPEAAAFHFGSYAMVVEPSGSTLRTLARRESRRALVSYDVNVRTTVESDPARWRATLEAMIPHTDLLKLSDEDFVRLFPGVDPQQAAVQWLQRGVAAVVLTRGAAGASAWTADGPVTAPPAPATVVDTVGAGDTFQAALLAGLAETGRLSPAALRATTAPQWSALLAFAARAAALTCTRRGADLPRRDELVPSILVAPGDTGDPFGAG